MSRPIGEKHSIEVAGFVAAFEKPFSKVAIEALETLKKTLDSKYPVFSTTKTLKVHLEGSTFKQQPSSEVSGVSLQQTKKDGRPAWTIRADNNNIIVSCFEYDKWKQTSSKALEDLFTVFSVVADDRNPLSLLALQVVDRFVGPSKNQYQLKQVFNTTSKFLTKQAASSGPLWHVHQGWFVEDKKFKGQFLNVLNLSTNDTPAGIISTIDHTIRYLLGPEEQPAQKITQKFMETIFNTLHDYNKIIFADLLNAKQKRAVGI